MFKTADMLKVFDKHRGDAIVVPGRGGKFWIDITRKESLDIPLGDPAMGGHCGFAFGLAMAVPQRKVVLFDSEGDLQMSLSILMSVAEQKPANFYHFMLDNECYATTGGQPVPNAKDVRYDLIAKGAGYPRAFAFSDLDEFSKALPDILEQKGPVFVALKIFAEIENEAIGKRRKWMTRTRQQSIQAMRKEVGIA
jgi:thiamine pyrophosphate-dependent acetolactate synthase large subunit-like protein